jgi:hypothetical protein
VRDARARPSIGATVGPPDRRTVGRSDGFASSRSGIALVVALGILTILAVLAVAFAVAMRTERLVARDYAQVVRGRELVHVALARAIDAVALDLEGPSNSLNDTVFPEWPGDCMGSPGGAPVILVLRSFITNYIPRSLWNDVVRAGSNDVSWVTVTNVEAGATNAVGRYAFLVINCGGLLDANRDGGTGTFPRARWAGTDPNEIALNSAILRDLRGNSGTNLAPGRRRPGTRVMGGANRPFVRAETVADLPVVGRGGYGANYPLQTGCPNFSNFFAYSYFPDGFCYDPIHEVAGLYQADRSRLAVRPRVVLGRTVEELLANETAIKDELRSFVAANGRRHWRSAFQVDTFFLNLVDFVDGDHLPGNRGDPTAAPAPDSFCTEATPLVNEYFVRGSLGAVTNAQGVLYTNLTTVAVEVWYPFVGFTNTESYLLRVVVQGSGGGTLSGLYSFNSTFDTPLTGSWLTNRMAVVTNTIVTQVQRPAPVAGSLNWNCQSLQAEIRDSADRVVDRARPMTGWPGPTIGVPLPYAPPAISYMNQEVRDPRQNYPGSTSGGGNDQNGYIEFFAWNSKQAGTGDPSPPTHTLGAVNHWSLSPSYGVRRLESKDFFVKDRPLESVGELAGLCFVGGYVTAPPMELASRNQTEDGTAGSHHYRCTGLNGQWIPAGVTEEPAAILDHFAISTNSRDAAHGKVNPNTWNTNVLASVFVGMPVMEYNGSEAPLYLNATQAVRIAERLIERGPYTNRQDLLNWFDYAYDAIAFGKSIGLDANIPSYRTANDAQAVDRIVKRRMQSILRNSLELLDPRQNLFTVILLAQPGIDSNGDGVIGNDETTGEQGAVVTVWRDPYAEDYTQSPYFHPTFVRRFRWIDEWPEQ